MVEGRTVGCQNHRGIIMTMDYLAKDNSAMQEDFENFLRRENLMRENLTDSHYWTTLQVFNTLIIGCGEIIMKHLRGIRDPYALLGSKVYLFWEFLMVKLIDILRILRSPGDVYDKIRVYTEMFNHMRVIEVLYDWVKVTRKSPLLTRIREHFIAFISFIFGGTDFRLIRDTLASGIDARTEDPSRTYIHGEFPYDLQKYNPFDTKRAGILGSIPRLIWNLPNAQPVTIMTVLDVLTYLSQDAIYPKHDIRGFFAANGDLVIEDRVYGRLVELEFQQAGVEREGKIIPELTYLGRIRKSPMNTDEVDFEAIQKGQPQLDGRQIAVLISQDLHKDGNLVLKAHVIFNAPYYLIKYTFQTPSVFSKFISLVQATGEFNGTEDQPDFAELKGFWRKFFRIISSGKKALLLPIILAMTVYKCINDSSSVMEQEIVNANRAARARLEKEDELETLFRDTIEALATAVEARDLYTKGHALDVQTLASQLAIRRGYKSELITLVTRAGILHDLGKIGIRDHLLLKEGPLTAEERKIMQDHTKWGWDLLTRGLANPELHRIAKLVRHHHECRDGTGYPDGLKGDEIPLGSQLLCYPDVWNALTTTRPYRQAMTHETAIRVMTVMQVIESLAGPQDMFADFMDMIKPGCLQGILFQQIIWDIYHGNIKKIEDRDKFKTNPEEYRANAVELLNRVQPQVLAENPNFFEDNAPT